jgi:Ca-activated chloride channel family protein
MNALDADTSHNISRLDAAKKTIMDILMLREHNKNVSLGLVIFAGQAQMVVPLSDDRIFFQQVLSAVSSDFVTTQSTNFEIGITEAVKSFHQSERLKTLIILTDGENHYGDLSKAISLVRQNNIDFFVIGIGSEAGSNIPANNFSSNNFLKDINGKDIITYLDIAVLRELSADFMLYPISFSDIQKINKSAEKSQDSTENQYASLFIILIMVCVVLLAIKQCV